MKPLSNEEIRTLLETESPEDVAFREASRLNDQTRSFLADELRQLEEVDTYLNEQGRKFRASLPKAPPFDREKLRLWQEELKRKESGNGMEEAVAARHRIFSRPWLWLSLLAVSGLACWFLLISLGDPVPDRTLSILKGTDRIRAADAPKVDKSAFYDSLLDRGDWFYSMGISENHQPFLLAAVQDYEAAADLAPEAQEPVGKLARTYRELGSEEKARFWENKLMNLQKQTDEEAEKQ